MEYFISSRIYDKKRNPERERAIGEKYRNFKKELSPVGSCHSNISLPYYFLIIRIMNLFNLFTEKIKGCTLNELENVAHMLNIHMKIIK